MAKITIKQQQHIINEFEKIINRIYARYKSYSRPMPDYQKMYIEGLQKQIQERKEWITNQHQIDRAKEYLTKYNSEAGSEPRLERCIMLRIQELEKEVVIKESEEEK